MSKGVWKPYFSCLTTAKGSQIAVFVLAVCGRHWKRPIMVYFHARRGTEDQKLLAVYGSTKTIHNWWRIVLPYTASKKTDSSRMVFVLNTISRGCWQKNAGHHVGGGVEVWLSLSFSILFSLILPNSIFNFDTDHITVAHQSHHTSHI